MLGRGFDIAHALVELAQIGHRRKTTRVQEEVEPVPTNSSLTNPTMPISAPWDREPWIVPTAGGAVSIADGGYAYAEHVRYIVVGEQKLRNTVHDGNGIMRDAEVVAIRRRRGDR